MFKKKLEEKKQRFDELHHLLADPGMIENNSSYQRYAKELASLQNMMRAYNDYVKLEKELHEVDVISKKEKDPELIRLATEEIKHLENKKSKLKDELMDMLSPQQQDADKDVIVEIRAGTGGLEASLFGANLFRMYSKYAARQNWKLEVISSNVTEKGGLKEVIFSLSGKNAYKKMRYESGAHRVQRVPETEASGRIHTSAATVAVLPEAEEVELEINPADLRIDVFRAGGHGGQAVNRTDSAVRITHLPTNMVVICQDERSQLKNKIRAMRVLRARLLDMIRQKQDKEIAETRKAQVGTGDRSEKIRTYNFPDKRVTDHRIGLTLHKLDDILEGDMDELINGLVEADKQARIKNLV